MLHYVPMPVSMKKHSSGEKYRLENQLWKHQVRGWIAVSAAGSHGQGSQKRSVSFPQTPVCYIMCWHVLRLSGATFVGNRTSQWPLEWLSLGVATYRHRRRCLLRCKVRTLSLLCTIWICTWQVVDVCRQVAQNGKPYNLEERCNGDANRYLITYVWYVLPAVREYDMVCAKCYA